ncbi:MAG: hypothetical protein LBV67_10695 [Streptococcaceae bacterium]|nr:hypothetical protein [Streptococcaceae bacterium]
MKNNKKIYLVLTLLYLSVSLFIVERNFVQAQTRAGVQITTLITPKPEVRPNLPSLGETVFFGISFVGLVISASSLFFFHLKSKQRREAQRDEKT